MDSPYWKRRREEEYQEKMELISKQKEISKKSKCRKESSKCSDGKD